MSVGQNTVEVSKGRSAPECNGELAKAKENPEAIEAAIAEAKAQVAAHEAAAKAREEERAKVNVPQLTQTLQGAFKAINELRIEGAQAELLIELKKAIAYVNNELAKVQNGLITPQPK